MSFLRYSVYKPTGIEWLGPVPKGWNVVAGRRMLSRRKQLNVGLSCDDRLALTMQGVVPRDMDDLDGLQASDFEAYQIVEKNDLLFKLIDLQNIKTSRVGLVPCTGIVSPAYIRLCVTDCRLLPRYAYWYFFRLYVLNVFNELGGGVRQTLGPEDLLSLAIVVPAISEQHAICAFLDRETAKIDALVAAQGRLIELLKEERQAVIFHSVTKGLNSQASMNASGIEWLGEMPAHWTCGAIRRFATVLRGKFTHRPRNDPAFYDGEFPFIQTGDITGSSRYIKGFKQTLNQRGASVSREFPKGTLVMAIAANIGDVAILNFSAYFPDSVVGLVPKAGVDLMYLYYLMIGMKQPMLMTATISTQMNLNVDQLCSLRVVLPPLCEQVDIVESLDKQLERIDRLSAESERVIGLLQERRTALISAAVAGQIDVRGLVEQEAA